MLKYVMIAVAVFSLVGCDAISAPHDYEVKACRHDLKQLATYAEMAPSQRLGFVNKCMAAQGWYPTGKCTTVHAEGTTHCGYAKR